MTLTATASIPGIAIATENGQLFFDYATKVDPLQTEDPPWTPNFGPHTVTISDGTIISIPERQPYTRWRYPWVSETVKMSPAQMVAQRLSFPYGNVGAKFRPIIPASYPDPTSYAALDRNQGDTGERNDIGEDTEWGAYFKVTGDSNYMMQTAEAAGTQPIFYDDIHTGCPISKITFKNANNYSYGHQYHGMPWFSAANDSPYGVHMAPNHAPQISYDAAVTTGSKWHLKNLQSAANFALLQNGSVSPEGLPYATPSEQRALAWELRDAAMAEVATKLFEKNGWDMSGCLPSSYFTTILAQTLKYVLQPLQNDPELQMSRALWKDGSGAYAPWQQCYINETLAFLVLTGHTEFHSVYLWHLQGIINFTSGKTGWPPALACDYWTYSGAGTSTGALPSMAAIYAMYITPKGTTPGGQLGDTLTQAQLDKLNADPFNGGNLVDPDGEGDYFETSHMNLAAALYMHAKGYLDVKTTCPDVQLAYDNVHRMLVNLDAAQTNPDHRWYMSYRNAIVTDDNQVPTTIIQPTPVGYQGQPAPPSAPPPVEPPPPPLAPPPTPDPQPQPENPPMSDPLASLNAAIATIKADIAAEIKAAHDRIVAIIAAATGTGTQVDPAELQAAVDQLATLHTSLSADTAALPTATN